MLPELIYREERSEDYPLLAFLGIVSVLLGFGFAKFLFPSETALLTVIFASIPLVYPLTRFFLEDEKENAPHIDEIAVYGAFFIGEVAAFMALGYFFPGSFELQSSIFGAAGFATNSVSFLSIMLNNMVVFSAILAVSAIIGSAGAFILTWNASVLGVFFASLISSLQNASGLLNCSPNPSPLCFVPHATFEMTGFIIAGVSGSLISAALYREHFDRETWEDYVKLVSLGVFFILLAAFLETA